MASPASEDLPLKFDRDIRPILADKCFSCHGPDPEHRKKNLRLDIESIAKKIAIVSGDSRKSKLVKRIVSSDPDERMPPPASNKSLSQKEIATLSRWIDQGATWSKHWSFSPPRDFPLPPVKDTSWPRNAIDYFVLHRLEREGLRPSTEAKRETLIRRLTLDLTGLPPTLEEVDAFLKDESPQAYEKVVDRLLNSPRYGERMTVKWLDLARYGDTSVCHTDGNRDMWAWRDGVVDAYNSNQSFDQFSTEQIAGDLIPNATLAQKVASGFNRNNGTTDEGGVIDEEYRVEYVVDRVKTTSMVWMGITLECAQCHDHKYDPISQEDYYRFFAFFNVSADKGRQSGARNAPPLVEILDEENLKKIPLVNAQIAQLQAEIKAYPDKIKPKLLQWINSIEKKITQLEGTFDPRDAELHLTLDSSQIALRKPNSKISPKVVVLGEPEWVRAKTLKGLRFVEGGTTSVKVEGVESIERDQSITLSLWFYPQKDSKNKDSQGSLIAKLEDDVTRKGFELYYQSNQRLYFELAHNTKDNALRVRSDREFQWNTWQHICFIYSGQPNNGRIEMFVDGEPWKLIREQDNLSNSVSTDKPLTIGSRVDGFHPIGILDEVRIFSRVLRREEIKALILKDTVKSVLDKPKGERAAEVEPALLQYYLKNVDKRYHGLTQQVKKLKEEEKELRRPKTTVMVMGDRQRSTFILRRGKYDDRTDQKVSPGIPVNLPQLKPKASQNRLGLAQWMFEKENPLTARVAVNRYWQLFFGVGLVATPEDFGSQGEYPSHPQLLDWLAADFRDQGWDVKRTLRTILTSATYRQSSSNAPELYARDPQNRLLARASRFRLQAEFLRDNALSLSGLLAEKMGGPGVKPYQPPKLWNEILQGGDPLFVQDHGEKLYRRSVYTYWRRTCPPPNMQIFDAPTREKCITQRSRTNTPLQALVTLNDVQYVEAARNFAQRMMLEGGEAVESRIAFGFRFATSRKIQQGELQTLMDVYRFSKRRYAKEPKVAMELISNGESMRDVTLDPVELGSLTIVASMILNLDETLTRE